MRMRELERSRFLLTLCVQLSDILYPARLFNAAGHRVSQYLRVPHDARLLHLRMGSDPRIEQAISAFSDSGAGERE